MVSSHCRGSSSEPKRRLWVVVHEGRPIIITYYNYCEFLITFCKQMKWSGVEDRIRGPRRRRRWTRWTSCHWAWRADNLRFSQRLWTSDGWWTSWRSGDKLRFRLGLGFRRSRHLINKTIDRRRHLSDNLGINRWMD